MRNGGHQEGMPENTSKRADFQGKFGCLAVYALIKEIRFITPMDGYSRTADQQHKLFLAGKSKCDGYTKISKHQLDLARDILIIDANDNPINDYGDHPYYKVLGDFWESIGMKWGGNFEGFRDIFHFEYKEQ
jgi:hypothetical protein